MTGKRTFLNLGCGNRYHADWINIDMRFRSPDVINHDLTKGIPLEDNSCDVVYHSNLLEHLRRTDALPFLLECYRVLKPGGILRVGVPDLERICSLYLEKLRLARSGDRAAAHDYEWIMLEMYDQVVREQSGGMMSAYLNHTPLPNEAFVFERLGAERHTLAKPEMQHSSHMDCPPASRGENQASVWPRIRIRRWLRLFLARLKDTILSHVLGSEGLRALKIGRFRLSGEVHHWMYDSYSLTQLLMAAGFQNPVIQAADRSNIPNWNDFHLDTLADGKAVKPSALFVECTKPGPNVFGTKVEGQSHGKE